jgi:prepilin-type N-terminal cleavage/methylation domain-containing protein
MSRRTNNLRSALGFTLMELLIVIAIMIFVSSIAVVNYFGAVRASSYSAGQKTILGALQLARQRACLDAAPTYFYILDATNYMIVRRGGVIIASSSGDGALPSDYRVQITPNACVLYDAYTDLSSMVGADAVTIGNMEEIINLDASPPIRGQIWKVEASHKENTATAPCSGLQ